MEAAFICTDDLWAGGFGGTHPLKPDRLKRIYELLTAYNAFDISNLHLIAPDPVSREDLLLFHTAEYVDAVARLSSSQGQDNGDVQARRYGFRPDETPAFPGMYEIEGLKVGAALTGARLIAGGQVQVAFSFAGGLHHARPSLASGFCVFNDVAVATHWLLHTGLPRPLLPAVRALHAPADLDKLEPYLPVEAYEALFWVASLGYSVDQALAKVAAKPLTPAAAVDVEDLDAALAHPDSRGRFVVVKNADKLVEMLNVPLEKWRVFLHPSQARLVTRDFNGPARAVVVDETLDLHPEELRLLRQIAPKGPNDMLLVDDAHQCTYGRPVVLNHCGNNIRGRCRSSKLRINYRTTEEIRDRAVSVLTDQSIDDLDGGLDDHLGYRSLLHGAPPSICHFESQTDEQAYMIGALESLIIGDNVPAETICVVARTSSLLENYRAAFEASGIDCLHLQADTRDDAGPGVRLATMHRVKDLELAHALIVGVNEDVIPSPHVSEDRMVQEQCLLHAAASRARDTVTVAG